MALFKAKGKHRQNKLNLYEEHQVSHGKSQGRKINNKNIAIAVISIIVIAAVLYYIFFLYVNQTVVNAPATANLTQAGTVFSVNSQQYVISLASTSMHSGKAYIHISRLPIFLNPLLNVTLTLNNITKINAGTVYTNMGVQLLSLGQNSITVKVTPLYTSLKINPDSQDISTITGTLYNSGQQPTGPATSVTTTVAGTSTTTTMTTSTVKTTNATAQSINTTLRQNDLYGLLLNFSVLYTNVSKCTPSLYNSTYTRVHSTVPLGQHAYKNESPYVPYNLSYSIESAGNGNFNAVFKTKTANSLFNNIIAATITVNPQSETTTNETLSGAFEGLTYTELLNNYNTAISVGGACGVEV